MSVNVKVEVDQVGCLGHCGKGPSIIVNSCHDSVSSSIFHHIATPSVALDLLRAYVDLSELDVQSMTKRLEGNQQAMDGNLNAALQLYTEALALLPIHGKHLILCNRSAVYLQLGMKQEAKIDAALALSIDRSHIKSWIRSIDATYAMGEFEEAALMFREALEIKGFKNSPEFKSIQSALSEKGQRV